ncbi:SsrA-binding protein SmpB [bacterium]|nr:SsrA-binding protein SmpB [bacterium]
MILARNKKVLTNYEILDKWKAGLVLTGPEVKSIKQKKINLESSYITMDKNQELWLINTHIAPYPPAGETQKSYNPTQPRKLLLNKKEIKSLIGKLQQKGLTLIPLMVYDKKGIIKVEIGLAKGLKKYDKREKIKKRETERRIRQIMHGKI